MGQYRLWCAALALGLLPLIGCASADTTASFDQNYNFQSKGTFDFPSEEQYPSSAGDVPPERMKRIQGEVKNVLVDKGFTYVPGDQPVDYIVALYGRVEEKLEQPDTGIIGYGLWPGWQDSTNSGARGGQDVTTSWEQGTVVADVIDAKQMKAVWRGTAKAVVGSQPLTDSDLRKAVEKLFKDFPPKAAGSGTKQ
jgi:hypothetical protein